MLKINGKSRILIRHNGKTAKVARLNGKVVWSSGLRAIDEEWNTLSPSMWLTACDPRPSMAYPYVEGGFLRAGIPPAMWSEKPPQSVYTREDADNAVGRWTVRTGNLGTAGLYSGVILGTDPQGSKMLELVFERQMLRLRYRTAATNAWINLGSNSAFRQAANDVIYVTRTIEAGVPRVRVYQNNVLRSNWQDSSGIPGADGTRRIGVRLQGDRGLFATDQSSAIAQFIFSTTP